MRRSSIELTMKALGFVIVACTSCNMTATEGTSAEADSENTEEAGMEEPPAAELEPQDARPIYEVGNLEELLKALGDNRIVRISNSINISEELKHVALLPEHLQTDDDDYGKKYLHTNYITQYYGLYSLYNNEADDSLLIKMAANNFEMFRNEQVYFEIHDCSNLTVEGQETEHVLTEIIVNNAEDAVVRFASTRSLTLRNFNMRHDPPNHNECGIDAPVVWFEGDRNAVIENCELNGCGTHGVKARNTGNLLLKNTTVFNCSEFGLHSIYSEGTRIEDCTFENNDLTALIYVENSPINIKNTRFEGNKADVLVSFNSLYEVGFQNCLMVENAIKDPQGDLLYWIDENRSVDYTRDQFGVD